MSSEGSRLEERVLTLEELFAELAKWAKFIQQENPGNNGESTGAVAVPNVDGGATNEVNRQGIHNPQGTRSAARGSGSKVLNKNQGFKDKSVIPLKIKTEPEDICQCKVEVEVESESSCSCSSDSDSAESAQKKIQNKRPRIPRKKKSLKSSTSELKSPFVSLQRLSSTQIYSIKKKMTVKSKPGWKCPHCPRILSCKSHLVNHIRSHTGERPFRCPHCPHVTSQAFNLRAHIRTIHPRENQKLFSCKLCGNKFQTRKILTKHMKKHLTCYFCSRVVASIQHMQHHLATHTGEKPVSCPHCQYSTACEHNLKEHIRRKHRNAK